MNLAELAGDIHRYSVDLFQSAGGEDWPAKLQLGGGFVLLVAFLVWVGLEVRKA